MGKCVAIRHLENTAWLQNLISDVVTYVTWTESIWWFYASKMHKSLQQSQGHFYWLTALLYFTVIFTPWPDSMGNNWTKFSYSILENVLSSRPQGSFKQPFNQHEFNILGPEASVAEAIPERCSISGRPIRPECLFMPYHICSLPFLRQMWQAQGHWRRHDSWHGVQGTVAGFGMTCKCKWGAVTSLFTYKLKLMP